MSKRTTKLLASSLSVALVASMVTLPSVASAATSTKLAGLNRYETSLEIVQAGWEKDSSENVIIASGENGNMADSLAAAPLAYKMGEAPILLTKTDSIPAGVLTELSRLGVKKVTIVGGEAAVSSVVEAELKETGLTVQRISGANRFETSLAIAKEAFGTTSTEVVIANGLASADALSVSAIAANKGMPILLVNNKTGLSQDQKDYIAGTTVYAVGGTTVLSEAIVGNATRLDGANRYETNAAILAKFAPDYSKIFLAKGTNANLVDALVGSAYAAKGNNPIVLVDSQDGINAKLMTEVTKHISVNSEIVSLGGKVTTSAVNAITGADSETLSVQSVSAISANAVQVTLNRVPEDTSKLAFEVQKSGNDVEVSTGWDTTGTKITLTKDAKLTEGTYTVKVMDGTTDLGTSDVTITAQEVAKINITSTKLGVTGSGDEQKGYATYSIQDQYGVDITTGALANNVQFQTGVGDVEARRGLITVTPADGLNLMTFNAGVTITANDTTSGIAGTATLDVTSQVGTLSSIELTELTNEDNKVLTAGTTTDIFYAEFTATDISGNPTSNYTLMQEGLILNGQDDDELTVSSPYVTAKLVQDPDDSNKGAIEVRATDTETLSVDMPLIITAMTWTGSTSQINTTLKKQAEVETFTILAPDESIASGESKNISFRAVDQNGVELTKFSDFTDDLVTFNGLIKTRNADGTLCLKNERKDNNSSSSVPLVLSAMTKSGKYSSVTVNIQKIVEADTLLIDTDSLKTVMQESTSDEKAAEQNVDFGWDDGGIIVEDQYGRNIDINATENNEVYENYRVVATSDNDKVIKIVADHDYAGVGETEIKIQSGENGSATVSFKLYDLGEVDSNDKTIYEDGSNDYSKLNSIDSKSETFTVLEDDDIKDYTMDEVIDPIYVSNGITAGRVTDQEADYDANPEVFGTTSAGAKVVLRGTPITGASSTSDDFTIITPEGDSYASDDIEIIANELADPAKTESNTILSITFLGADGNIHIQTTPITASTIDPLAESLDVNAATEVEGIERLDDVVTLTGDYAALLGDTLAAFDENGSEGTQNVYFAPVDQYGSEAWPLSQFIVVTSDNEDGLTTSTTNGSTFTLSRKGTITGTMVTGDWVTVSGTTTNGLMKTIRINFGVNSTSTTPIAVTPAKPEVSAEDTTNVITGIDATMEYAIEDATTYTKYVAAEAPDLSGDKIVKVRVAAEGINLVSADTTLTFTTNVDATEFVQSATYNVGPFGNSTVIKVLDSSIVTGVKLNDVDLEKDVKYLINDATTITVSTVSQPADNAIVLVTADATYEVVGVK